MAHSINELRVLRANTRAFIRANPTVLRLVPRVTLRRGTGTQYVSGDPRAPQTMRIVDQSRTFGPQPGSRVATDGTARKIEYQLVGLWDAVIGLWDHWMDDQGFRWEVVDLMPGNGYEQRAQVVRHGES